MKARQIIGLFFILLLLAGTGFWVAAGQPLPGDKTTVTIKR